MNNKISKLIDQAIWFSYLALAVITPLLFSTKNTELFEVPKMIFVYFAATVILFLTLAKFVLAGKITVPKSWAVIVFLIFLAIQALSTVFSIDKFTSIFGYPSRLNGGLLSQFAYFAILATAIVNLNLAKARQLLLAIIASAIAVSAWGIPAHFGRDPSCLILTGKLSSNCWQKEFDPTIRIFSTLGQPNWLASYLVLILPLALAFAISFKKTKIQLLFAAISIFIFWAHILTNSRAGLIGIALAFLIFLFLLGVKTIKNNLKILVSIFAAFAIVTLIFGTTLISRINEALIKNPSTPQSTTNQPGPSNQEPVTKVAGPTESGQIRLIVWQGAKNAFLKRPILGWGPETFAYSYYLFRPTAHNQTTEWNFFYNKAHNEFLNYLANIGILGISAYLGFLLLILWQLYKIRQDKSVEKSQISKAVIAAIIGYQTTIFFGFSTVASQIIMFLLVAAVFALADQKIHKEIKIKFLRGNIAKIITTSLLVTIGVYALIFFGRIFLADLLMTRAKALDSPQSLTTYSNAIATFPTANPFYLADFAYESAIYAASSDSPQIAKGLATQTDALAQKALLQSPNNLIIERRIANAYFLASAVEEKYGKQALEVGQKLAQLAPTDPQSYLTFAKIQAGLGKNEEAKRTLEVALSLKPDYQEAQELLDQLNSKAIQ